MSQSSSGPTVPLAEHPVNDTPSTLTLRIVQPGSPDRTETLTQAKYTVGSSARCQIHVPSPHVKPLHCLIVQNDRGLVVTRWAAGVVLNGHEFTSASLGVGDCLSIGDVEIYVLSADDEAQHDTSSDHQEDTALNVEKNTERLQALCQEEIQTQEQITPLPAVEVRPSSKESYSAHEYEFLETARSNNRTRCRKLVHSLRDLRGQVGTLEQKIAQLQREYVSASQDREHLNSKLQQVQAQLTRSDQENSTEVDRLIGELNDAFAKAEHSESVVKQQSTTLEQLQNQLEGLQGQCAELERIRAAGELQRSKLAQAVADRDRSVETLQEELTRLRAEEDTSAEELNKAVNRLEELQSELERLKSERDELADVRSNYQLREMEWEQAVEDREIRLKQLSSENEELLSAIQKEKDQWTQRSEQFSVLEEELKKLQLERDDLESKLGSQQNAVRSLEQEISNREQILHEKEKECNSLNEFLQSFEQGAFEQTEKNNLLEAALHEVKQECESLKASSSEHFEQIQGLEQQLSQRNELIEQLNSELEDTLQKLGNLEAQSSESSGHRQKLEADLEQLRLYYQQLSAERDGVVQEKEQLQVVHQEMELDLQSMKEKLAAGDKKSKELQECLAAEATSNERLQMEFAQFKERYEELEQQKNEEVCLRQEAQQQLVQGKQQSELFEADLQIVRAELKRVQEEKTQLDSELVTAQEQVATLSYELEANVGLPQEEADSESPARLIKLQEENALLAERTQEQEGKIEKLSNEMTQLEALRQETQLELDSVRQELQSSQEALQQRLVQPGFQESKPVFEPELSSESKLPNSQENYAKAETEIDVVSGQEEVEIPEVPNEDLEESPSQVNSGTEFFAPPERSEESEFQPTSYIEQFQHMIDETGETTFDQPEPAPVRSVSPESSPEGLQGESDDAALEAYMSNLMKRMRGEENADIPTPVTESAVLDQDPDPLVAVDQVAHRVAGIKEVTTQSAPQETLPSDEPLDLEALRTASNKPEFPSDLSAMRELANTSARKAIASHHKRRHFEKTTGSFLVCVIAIAVGLYMMLASESMLTVQFFGGAIAAIVGAFGGGKLLRLVVEGVQQGAWKEDAPEEINEEQAPLPIDGAEGQ